MQEESAKTMRTRAREYQQTSAVRNYRWTVGSGQQGKPMEGLRKEVMRVQEENEKEKGA